jgi:hypothetical protein
MSLKKASEELRYLLNRGYKKSSALTFICNHYQLTKKDRHFLARSIFSNHLIETITSKKLPIESMHNQSIFIDGYNVLITTEAVLTNQAFICDDSVVRDTKGIFGKYKITDLTHEALSHIYTLLNNYSPHSATFYLDKQVSHSGDLCALIRPHFPCETIIHVDDHLASLNTITATSDTILIQKIDRFVDLPFGVMLSIDL